MERKEILDEAARIVTGERQNQYGSAEDSFALIGGLWSDYMGVRISPIDVALMMILLKVAREKGGKGKADNWIDIAGYAACGGEVATARRTDDPDINVAKIVADNEYKRELLRAIFKDADKADEPHDSLEDAKKAIYERFTRRMNEEFQKEYEDKDAALMWEKYELKVLVRKLRDMSDLLYQYANRLKKEEGEEDED